MKSDDKLNKLFKSLKEINAKLWVIEDDKRMCEKNSDFTENFIKLSRDVHFLNDDRAKIKLEINNHTGSKIKEIKEYTDEKEKIILIENYIFFLNILLSCELKKS